MILVYSHPLEMCMFRIDVSFLLPSREGICLNLQEKEIFFASSPEPDVS